MTKSALILYMIVALFLVLAVGGFLHLYNTQQEETKQQAITSLDQGIALFQEKKYAESLEVLQGIPDGVVRDWHLPYYTATAHVMLKDYESAAPILEKALELNPENTQIMFELGVIYYKLGNLALSKGYFGSVIAIDPSNEEAKGLMDIMANLERQQPGAEITEPEEKTEN
jgi:tetratricopeptide (TPR) repeat protein